MVLICESVLVQPERVSSSEAGYGTSGEQICFDQKAKVDENIIVLGESLGA